MSVGRRALLPAPTLPLAYFLGAHLSLGLAAAIMTVSPDMPGAFHYHPRMLAVIHLVTLGWISASIVGAFYIVAPLAFGMPFAARGADHAAFASFWCGSAGMVLGFWRPQYGLVGAASLGVVAALAFVAVRAGRGLMRARVPPGVALHVALAFLNIVGAGCVGAVLALVRVNGGASWSPLAMAAAHAHLAVLGWAVMMIVGVAYRLVPMFLPAALPAGRSLAVSAVLLEIGTLGVAWALARGTPTLPWALVVLAGIGAFLYQVRAVLANRRARPAEMTGRDWSTWQTHTALAYLAVAAAAGVLIAGAEVPLAWHWAYGVAGILGFVAQMVVGIQGRLLPMHAWYRAMASLDGAPPAVSAHRLADGRLALAVFVGWCVAVPTLAVGLAAGWPRVIATGAGALLVTTVLQVVHLALIVRRATRV